MNDQEPEEMNEDDFKNHQNPDLIILHKNNEQNNIGRVIKQKIDEDERV